MVNVSYAAIPSTPIVCTQQYALCTSASCVSDPRHLGYAICTCAVEQGDSVGYKTCTQRAPTHDRFKTQQIISTFSFAQFATKKSMLCSKGIPWTNCVDAPCTIDPLDATKALCSCPVNHSQAFFTFGGDCNTKTCTNGFWSGTTTSVGLALRMALIEKLKLSPNSWANTTCQGTVGATH